MFLIPNNQTYSSEAIIKTVLAPLVILIFCVLAVISFNPFTEAGVARLFGLEKKISIRVERVEHRNPTAPTKGWSCYYWIAHGAYDGRDIFTRACNTQVAAPKEGDILELAIAPQGSEGYLLERGGYSGKATVAAAIVIALGFVYGVFISLRLLYIGYSSNWFKDRK